MQVSASESLVYCRGCQFGIFLFFFFLLTQKLNWRIGGSALCDALSPLLSQKQSVSVDSMFNWRIAAKIF